MDADEMSAIIVEAIQNQKECGELTEITDVRISLDGDGFVVEAGDAMFDFQPRAYYF